MTKQTKEKKTVKYIYVIPLDDELLGKATIPFCIPAGGEVAERAKEYIMTNNLNYLGGRLFVEVNTDERS
ncbi:MAG TPA: hypothetical protein DCM40_34365 [Maribacter sp.]|jgi:hypothetical protein|nr:hypothetical protein [Maribacter sp.]|tara:strand:+ start:1447 stop:1656 length:210 start_codon:yes stop_codon:yes gene_type:complete